MVTTMETEPEHEKDNKLNELRGINIDEDAILQIAKRRFKDDQKQKMKTKLFMPDHYFIQIWNILIIFVLIAACIITPLRLAFLKQN